MDGRKKRGTKKLDGEKRLGFYGTDGNLGKGQPKVPGVAHKRDIEKVGSERKPRLLGG